MSSSTRRSQGHGKSCVGIGLVKQLYILNNTWGDVDGARGGGGSNEGMQTISRIVPDLGEADAPRPVTDDLDDAGDQQFSLVTTPAPTGGRVVPGLVLDHGFVDFQQARQGVALGGNHRAPKLGAQEPGRLVGPEAELLPCVVQS